MTRQLTDVRIVTIDRYHREADQRYQAAMSRWRASTSSGQPFRGMFLFLKLNGMPRRSGYVVHRAATDCWFATKRAAINRVLEWFEEDKYAYPDI